MAWVSKRKAAAGTARYVANYRDPTDAKRSAGTFRSRAEADLAGHAAEIRIRDQVRLDELLADPGDVVRYVYDYGDEWIHALKLEKVKPEPCIHPRGTGV